MIVLCQLRFLAATSAIGTLLCGCGSDTAGPGRESIEAASFIGGPCDDDGDCDYRGGICLLQGVTVGFCSLPCDRFCPDRAGEPVTFCVAADEVNATPAELAEGGCVSRCHMGLFPETGCRDGYGCVVVDRYNEPQTLQYACLPGRSSELSACHLDLAARGASFEPTMLAEESPAGLPNLICSVPEPVRLLSPVSGVALSFPDGSPSAIVGSCELAQAVTSTVEDLEAHGVTVLEHGESYGCRVIAGTDTLSRHGYGDAIDLHGFRLADGTHYTLVDDWEHDTPSPQTPGGQFLYDTAQRWFDQGLWNIVLTPNYNADHDNHFHVDLTPGAHTLQ